MDSLQSLCLKVIVKDFEQFHFLTVSKDARLQRHMQFLQRRFSYYLATELLEDYEKTNLYFDFLINEHLDYIDFEWFRGSRYWSSFDDIFQRLPNLRSITFYSRGDDILESVVKFCPKIVRIEDQFSTITDKGIKYLCEAKNGLPPCPQLKQILISNPVTPITDEAVECLIRSVPSIEKIDYPNLPLVLHSVHQEILSDPLKVRYFNITELDLECCEHVPNFTQVLKTCLSVCPKLVKMYCHLSKRKHLNALTRSHLKELILNFRERIPHINIDNFLKSSGRNLICLGLSNCAVSISALALHCPALQDLRMSNVDVTGDLHAKGFFPCLKNCTVSEKSSSIIRIMSSISLSSPKLECVTFANCIVFSDLKEDVLAWCKSSVVKEITFWRIPLEMDFLRDFILNCHSLKYLYLDTCSYDVYDPEMILNTFIENLPNKIEIEII